MTQSPVRSAAPSGNGRLLALTVGTLGVVYGDIGTSPLYAFRESFAARPDVHVVHDNVLGVLSLITWALILVISIKYLVFVMRADHDGEGGILALTALVPRPGSHHGKGLRRALILIGIFGTALLYGDGMITPAISVLSAVEGIRVATPAFDHLVIPISIAILIGLFAIQRHGTGGVGAVFGPVMVVWFSVLGLLGLRAILGAPAVLTAIWPGHALSFFLDNGVSGFLVLGSVFLVVTGGEALYADMGHFGKRPIRIGWFSLVLPGLLLNYYGQGALLLGRPGAIDNPFYRLAPDWATLPLVLLATVATVIASQALISGAFSLTMQAVQMGYLPRVRILHTSEEERGQVYIAAVNWGLMVACVGLVIGFRTSANLAAAYGVAVTTTMVITTLLFYVVARERFRWSRAGALVLCAGFLIVDVAFFGANLVKIPDGGWFPLLVGGMIFTVMTTWRHGRMLLNARLRKGQVSVAEFLASFDGHAPDRVAGTAVYLSTVAGHVPASLMSNLRHNNALHEQVVLVTVRFSGRSHVSPARRAEFTVRPHGFVEVVLHFGYRDQGDVPRALHERVAGPAGLDLGDVTYVIGRERVLATDRPGMALWRERLFSFLSRNATDVTETFCLPIERVMEVGRVVDI